MKAWWNGLQSRERQLILVASVIVLVFAVYTFAWAPLQKQTKRLTRQVETQQQQLAAMQQMAAKIKLLGKFGKGTSRKTTTSSLTALVYQTGQKTLRGAQLKRVEEGQKRSVRVWVEKVAFDDMLIWLEKLQKTHGVSVDSFVAERQSEPGRVNARLTLKAS